MFELTDLVLGTFLIIVFLVGVGLLVREAIEELRPQRSVGYRRSRRPRLRFRKSVDKSGLVRYSREADGGVGVMSQAVLALGFYNLYTQMLEALFPFGLDREPAPSHPTFLKES